MVSITDGRSTLKKNHSGGEDKINLFKLDTSSALTLGALVEPTTTNSGEKLYTTASAEHYLVSFGITPGTQTTYSYQSTSEFKCPFDSSYNDSRGIFEACVPGAADNVPSVPSSPSIPVFGDSLLQVADQSDAAPIHDLGVVEKGQVLKIRIRLPKTIKRYPNSFKVTILDSNGDPLSPQPCPFGFFLAVEPYLS